MFVSFVTVENETQKATSIGLILIGSIDAKTLVLIRMN